MDDADSHFGLHPFITLPNSCFSKPAFGLADTPNRCPALRTLRHQAGHIAEMEAAQDFPLGPAAALN